MGKAIADIGHLLTGNIVAKVIGVIALMIFTRILPKEQLALFPVYMMLSGLATLIFGFGILPTFVKILPAALKEKKGEARAIVLTGALLILTGTLAVSVASFFFADVLAQYLLKDVTLSSMVRIMSIAFVAVSINQIIERILWAAGQFRKKSIILVFRSLSRIILVLVFYLQFSVVGLVWGLVVNEALVAILSLFFVKNIIYGSLPAFYSPKRLLIQSFPFYFESYLMYFRSEGDNWLVSSFMGPSALAVYYVAKTIYSMIFILFSSVDKVVVQMLAEVKSSISVVENKFHLIFIYLSQCSIPLIFFVIALLPTIIQVVGGGKFPGAVLPAAILLLAVLVQFLRLPINRSVFVICTPVTRLKITLIETVSLLLCLAVLTPFFGSPGVASARVCASVAGGGWGYAVLKSYMCAHLPFNKLILPTICAFPPTVLTFALQYRWGNIFLLPLYVVLWLMVFLVITKVVNREFFNIVSEFMPKMWRKDKTVCTK